MRLLRGENGCPWDKKQTHTSLRPYLIEEAYETAMAIDEGDEQHIAEELGDVLLQIALHAVIGEEYGTMDLSEMTTAICQKMIARHRHVFGEDNCRTPEEVMDNWARIKMEERGQKTYGETMLEIKRGMPPMLRAYKVQKKAADIGFDWDNAYGVLDKVLEEAQEIREEMNKGADPSLEVGDLFFSCVNLARLLKVDSEKILSQATEKFINRFIRMEKFAQKDKKSLKSLTIDEFSVYWDRSKAE
jgi:tetrapyrrole methylase family protein/MazG family protein